MQVVQEIRTTDAETLTIKVPEELRQRDVQITIVPLDEKEMSKEDARKTSFFQFVERFHYKLPKDYKFDREELYDR